MSSGGAVADPECGPVWDFSILPGNPSRSSALLLVFVAPVFNKTPIMSFATAKKVRMDEVGRRLHPFSVVPDSKVSVRDIMSIMRDYYEGTVQTILAARIVASLQNF